MIKPRNTFDIAELIFIIQKKIVLFSTLFVIYRGY